MSDLFRSVHQPPAASERQYLPTRPPLPQRTLPLLLQTDVFSSLLPTPVFLTHGLVLAIRLCILLPSTHSHEHLHYDVTHFPQSHRSTPNLPHSFLDTTHLDVLLTVIRCFSLSYLVGCCLVTPLLVLRILSITMGSLLLCFSNFSGTVSFDRIIIVDPPYVLHSDSAATRR